MDIVNCEVLLVSSFKNIARLDGDRRQHGGLLIEQSYISAFNFVEFTISKFSFTISCAVLSDKLSFFCLSTTSQNHQSIKWTSLTYWRVVSPTILIIDYGCLLRCLSYMGFQFSKY